tara:strand:+ start:84 stop:590 length:507 start_codon:yes stop_codon:yes gene_type:complete
VNPIIIKNNFFKDPDTVAEYSKTLDFKPPLSYQLWPGLRTDNLSDIDKNFFLDVMLKILSTLYSDKEFRFEDSWLHFHKIKKGDKAKISYHKDKGFKLASVIYLTKNGDIDNGTTIFDENGNKQVIVANKYNSMVLYESNKLHGATNMDFDEERLTLIAFFKDIIVAN